MENIIILLMLLSLVGCGKADKVKEISELSTSCLIIGDKAPDWINIDNNLDEIETLNLSNAVGILDVSGKTPYRCTAFLISPNVIMTNNHCIVDEPNLNFTKISFDNRKNYYKCTKLIDKNKGLDVALLKCTGNPGLTQGYLSLSSKPPFEGQEISLIHQNCNHNEDKSCFPSKIVSKGNVLEHTRVGSYDPIFENPNSIAHNADTLGGSSGAPILDFYTGEVIALHNQGLVDFDNFLATGKTGKGVKNGGIKINLIKDFIEENHPSLLPESPFIVNDPIAFNLSSISSSILELKNDSNLLELHFSLFGPKAQIQQIRKIELFVDGRLVETLIPESNINEIYSLTYPLERPKSVKARIQLKNGNIFENILKSTNC